MTPQNRKSEQNSFKRAFFDDLVGTRFDRDYLTELRELYYFYLSDEDRAKLAEMGRFKRAFALLGWTLKNMLVRLSPPRRAMLVIALLLAMVGKVAFTLGTFREIDVDLSRWGFALVFIVLMLELKDKLVARDEIEIARQVQMALLPSIHPDLPGWSVWSYSQPAREVGGDLVDYLELDGFRHGVLLGDVAGKGLGAAMLSAKLQATFRALVPDTVTLCELGSRVNAVFANDGISNRYATLFYTELEHHSGQVRFLNAGHNPAHVLRAGKIDSLTASSFPIGMFEVANYEEASIEMEPGEMLVVYSDGLTEAENHAGEEFGVDRVEKLLPELRTLNSEDAGRRILREVSQFLGDVRPNDDLSLVVIVKQ